MTEDKPPGFCGKVDRPPLAALEKIGQGVDIGLKVLGAIVVWIVGSWLISFTNKMFYWQVYFDANRMIRESFAKGELPLPG